MIVPSVLDNDLYVFSVSYVFFRNYPDAEGIFEFKDRNKEVYTPEFVKLLNEEIKSLSNLILSDQEFKWLCEHIKYIPRVYFEWLRSFRYEQERVHVSLTEEGHLSLYIEGPIYKTMLYEVPLLAIISELVSKTKDYTITSDALLNRLIPKIELANEKNLMFSEFGTRRRHSFNTHDIVLGYIAENSNTCVGTSNVYFAKKYDMTPIGTMNHAYIEFVGSQYGYPLANQMAMDVWSDTYRGDLGTYLTDTYTTPIFFKNLDKMHALLFTGVRQDSGDEYKFTDRMIERYKELGIDPRSKTIIFSNALDFPKFAKIAEYCEGKIGCAAGIGTNLTNDTGYPRPNIVIKLVRSKMNSKQVWRECIKLSDDSGKHQGNQNEIELCLKTLQL